MADYSEYDQQVAANYARAQPIIEQLYHLTRPVLGADSFADDFEWLTAIHKACQAFIDLRLEGIPEQVEDNSDE